MDEKSHVGMGYHLCPVCGQEHDEVVLLDKRLKKSLSRRQCVGWKLCPQDRKKRYEGYIALIEVNNQPQRLEDADRTGNIVHVRREAWARVFNVPEPVGDFAFVEAGTIALLREKVA